jgi:hypothetical protein
MVIQQQMVHSGWWQLRHQVLEACGRATKFSPLEQYLAAWVDSGADAAPATTDSVLRYLAGYLQTAAEVGKKWGTVAGSALGAALGVVAFVIARVVGS